MIRQLAALAGGLALSIGLAAPANAATDQDPPIRTEWMPCQFDEGAVRNCVWDAQHEGNGLGNSFFASQKGRIWVIPHHIAHYLINGNNARGEYFACPYDGSITTDCIWEERVWLGRSGNDTPIPANIGRYLLSRDA